MLSSFGIKSAADCVRGTKVLLMMQRFLVPPYAFGTKMRAHKRSTGLFLLVLINIPPKWNDRIFGKEWEFFVTTIFANGQSLKKRVSVHR